MSNKYFCILNDICIFFYYRVILLTVTWYDVINSYILGTGKSNYVFNVQLALKYLLFIIINNFLAMFYK